MRVTLVVDRYAPEARSAAHLFEDLARSLAARGHDVRVLAKYPVENLPGASGPPPRREIREGVSVTRLSSPLGEPRATWLRGVDHALFAVRVFLRLAFFRRPDVVLVYSPPLMLAGACAACDLLGLPVVINLHDLYPRTAIELGRLRSPALIALARRLERFVYKHARALIVPAPESATYLISSMGLQPDKVSLVYNWVETASPDATGGEAFRRSIGLDPGAFVVSYAGLLGLAQDLSAVIEAARQARDDRQLVFLVIGEGPQLNRWKAEAQGLANLRFLSTLPRDCYFDALKASDICLLALSADLKSPAIPGKLQSIMAAARPVLAIVPSSSAAAMVVEESACGVVSAPGDGTALLDAMTIMRLDPDLRRRMGAAGRRYAGEHFDLSRAVDHFERVLTSTKH